MPQISSTNPPIYIPKALIWVQCIAFMVLYGFWILPEIVGFRNTALVIGALAGLYPIYQYRSYFLQKRAIPIWLIVGLFAWATFHLFFLSQDYALQLLEYKRIWKFTALGSIFALGLGLSLAHYSSNSPHPKSSFWPIIYLGLCFPLLIYLVKYCLTTYGAFLGIQVPAYLQIYFESQPYYVSKSDYVAFCLPVLAVSFGQIQALLMATSDQRGRDYWAIALYLIVIMGTLFLFYIQDIKNGMAYSVLITMFFCAFLIFRPSPGKSSRNYLFVFMVAVILVTALYPHVQKNRSWNMLIADAKIGVQLHKYQQWKLKEGWILPKNEYNVEVSGSNYVRVAWIKAGLLLSVQTPLGYGLIEDSFKKMAKAKWPDISPNLSHSHSGWLDVILAIGYPGFFCIFGALIGVLIQSRGGLEPWRALVVWGQVANMVLWSTTEVSATVSFAALLFWISWASGLTLRNK